MVDSIAVAYPHRKKMDGSSNALCLNCLATIAMEQDAAEIVEHTPHHICNPGLLVEREIPERGRAA
jgi:hypothetical protein